jgi:hypothetical protein
MVEYWVRRTCHSWGGWCLRVSYRHGTRPHEDRYHNHHCSVHYLPASSVMVDCGPSPGNRGNHSSWIFHRRIFHRRIRTSVEGRWMCYRMSGLHHRLEGWVISLCRRTWCNHQCSVHLLCSQCSIAHPPSFHRRTNPTMENPTMENPRTVIPTIARTRTTVHHHRTCW